MSKRLYYDDAYLTRFSAQVVEQLEWEGRPAVVLDRSAFYPTGGGQPHDAGALAGVAVVDVVERESDGAVVHVLAAPLDVGAVEGQVNWERRFDLMQQHSGQHILSAAFVEHLGANTVGFYLSAEYATIDLDRAPLPVEQLAGVEDWANAVVFEDRPVVARWVTDEEAAGLPLRKPPAHAGPLRVVEVPDFDCSACGGTHLRATGQVGLIKITRSERRGAETRVEFLCGRRALADYRAKNAMLMGLAAEFTVGHWQVDNLVHRLAADLKETRRELRRTRDALLDAEAAALWREAPIVGGARLVKAHFTGRAMDDLKHLARRLVEQPRTAALLATEGPPGEKSYFTFACSADLDLQTPKGDLLCVSNLVREACQLIGGRGGGRPHFAQGGGPQGERVAEALEAAYHTLAGSLMA